MPTLSVITLTRDRLTKLEAVLHRLLPQLREGDEVLVVDTGSSDGTREAIARRRPPARLLSWAGEGSWAEIRNFAVAHARGELIAFLDDDCLPAGDWAACGRSALADADAVGGIARPHGIRDYPRWWHPEMAWMVGLSVPGHVGPDAGRIHYPSTSNLWVRASVCRAVPFQELGGDLGQTDERVRYAAGREDAQWWRTLRTGGYRTRFDPALTVAHWIDPARIDLDYLRGRASRDGEAWARREGRREHLAPLAYQWWVQLCEQWLAFARSTGAVRPQWHYSGLMRRRHGEAIRTILDVEDPTNPVPAEHRAVPVLVRAGARFGWDRAKSGGRRAAGPLLKARPTAKPPLELESLAVIALGYVGDLVILRAVLRGLIDAHPRLCLHLLVPETGPALLDGLSRTRLHVLPRTRPSAAWIDQWLRELAPDAIAAAYLHPPWGGEVVRVDRPPRPIVGFDSDLGLKRQWQLERLDVRVHKRWDLPERDNIAALFAQIGLSCEPRDPELHPLPGARARVLNHPWFHSVGPVAGAPTVMFNPDAGYASKEWTDEGWITLARLILQQTPWRILVNEPRPRPELGRALLAVDPNGNRVGRLARGMLEDFVAWMSLCRAIVTTDSGPQHLAHALDVPSVTLYGPTDERRWGDPLRRPMHRTLRACTPDLTPDEKIGLPENHETGLIAPERVFEELQHLMTDSEVEAC